MVPTSKSLAPARDMISGIRKEPPISTNSPLDTATSFRSAKLFSVSITAAALLLTTVAASAPVSSESWASKCLSLSPLFPEARSNSRLLAPTETETTASIASRGKGALPKFVWSTVPVKLNKGLRLGENDSARYLFTSDTRFFIVGIFWGAVE